jgi:hypothetical protein
MQCKIGDWTAACVVKGGGGRGPKCCQLVAELLLPVSHYCHQIEANVIGRVAGNAGLDLRSNSLEPVHLQGQAAESAMQCIQ